MANVCEYKVIVKGKKNGCYAFLGSMSTMNSRDIVEEHGTDDEFEMFFEGDCKWSVDSYCTPYTWNIPVELPEDPDEAYEEANEKYWYNTVQERSAMFQVEVYCNSADVDDFYEGIFEHYICGEPVYDDVPEDIVEKLSVNPKVWDEDE